MEQALDVYALPPSDEEPTVCMDEASKQLLEGLHEASPAAPGRAAREDYHYERRGVRAISLSFDPDRNWRRVSCRESRTRLDRAHEVRRLLEEDDPKARKVRLVCDNLNTHTIAAPYAAFPAEEAHRLARRLEIVHTPRHGELAEHGGDRAVGAGAAVPGAADRRPGGVGLGVRGVGARPERRGRSGDLEVYDGGRPGQAEASLPTNLE